MGDPDPSTPPVYVDGRLADFWNRPVQELVTVTSPTFTPEERERRRLFSLLVMALVCEYWNGNKYGAGGEYPWRNAKQRLAEGSYSGGTYLGHNIAAIAVDGEGRVIDFDFNHNSVFNSSVEHAESRLIRRVFSLAQLQEEWRPALGPPPPDVRATRAVGRSYATALSDVTVYTTLEPCAQCAGIMALGLVHEVVFLQRDPGEYLVGNILHNLTKEAARAPLPIPAGDFGFEYFDELNATYQSFKAEIAQRPFYISPKWTDTSPAISAFLCTDNALDIYMRATDELRSFRPRFPANAEACRGVIEFLDYAQAKGRRGTPHRV